MLDSHHRAAALPNEKGYTYTLASHLGRLLREAEKIYGPRDKVWTVLGIEFGPGAPQLWFPLARDQIIIQLSKEAIDNHEIAIYQLAHECVHLLAPEHGPDAPVIEEGVATVFSEDWTDREFGQKARTELESYKAAARTVRELLTIDPEAISKLRAKQSSFRKFTSETFDLAGLVVPSELVARLLCPFERE